MHPEIEMLRGEPPVRCEIRTERGAPRFFMDGRERYPMVVWSWGLVATSDGERTLRLPRALRPVEGGSSEDVHRLDLAYGDVRVFVKG